MKIQYALAITIALSPIAVAAQSAEPSPIQLVGTWVMCQDPDHSPADSLEFYEEGYGFNLRPNKPKTPFLYKEASGQLLLAANARGNLINIYLSVDPEHKRLTLKNDRNGNEAFYVRKGQEKQYSCNAK